jgi:HEAT repeat protein
MRFSDYALWSKDPVARKHALMNLSLMGCRHAKDAVISGLYDPDASVRRAAAMSAGLYDDKGVHMALEHYFEKHRYDLTVSFVDGGLEYLGKRLRTAKTRLCPT